MLSPADPPPVEIVHARGEIAALLCCDHAGREIPRALDRLGLDDHALAQHISWDLGAAALTRALAARIGAAAVLATYSRLVIDCNRPPGDPTSIAPASDGIDIPGNRDLPDAARAARIEAIFRPYHAAIAAALDRLHASRHRPGAALDAKPALICIHSFTPVMNGFERPWHCGVLWDRDERLALPLMSALRAGGDLVVADNEPYSGRGPAGYTMAAHGAARGWPHVMIEVRQDLLATDTGIAWWADVLAEALQPLL